MTGLKDVLKEKVINSAKLSKNISLIFTTILIIIKSTTILIVNQINFFVHLNRNN